MFSSGQNFSTPFTLNLLLSGLLTMFHRCKGTNIDALYEDIHWLLLIATNVIMMDCNDKEASIPTDILMFESQQQKRGETDVHLSVNYISNLGRSCSTDKGQRFCLKMLHYFSRIKPVSFYTSQYLL